MKVVVITGSTHGIGYGLADSFLSLGCKVAISSRSQDSVSKAVNSLQLKYSKDDVWGQVCDVSKYESVQSLWDNAKANFGRVEIWINNAGQSNPQAAFWLQSEEKIKSIVESNLLGEMYGVKVAISNMLQQGFGAVYNMLGLGSNGMHVDGWALYGSTKYAIKYLTDALIKETKGKPVLIGSISPGMVITDLLVGEDENHFRDSKKMKRIFNILADKVETVTPWLAKTILNNKKHGKNIAWLTKRKIAFRFLISPFYKRNILD